MKSPKSPINIRPAVAGDLAFIDGLQKVYSKNVGWMRTKAIETKIARGEIIIAEDVKREDVIGAESSHVFACSDWLPHGPGSVLQAG